MAVRFPAVKLHKYGAKSTEVDGITFPSKAEAQRWNELRLLEKAKVITDLIRQPRYPLLVNGVLIAEYRADFQYREKGELITEERKGFETPEWKLKHKLFRACYPDKKLIVIYSGKKK